MSEDRKTLPPHCNWPACAEYDDNCRLGIATRCQVRSPAAPGPLKEIPESAIEAACAAYWQEHWHGHFTPKRKDQIREAMRRALEAAADAIAKGKRA